MSIPRLKYPVGISTFRNIREGGYVYVDKTRLIYELVSDYTYVFLSRPRRFGKSLLASTIEAYFRGEKDLFEGLEIEELEKEWKEYPVLRFDLSGENFNHPVRLIDHISGCLKEYEEIYGIKVKGSIAQRFKSVIRAAAEQAGGKVVIIVDEYDKPMLDSLTLESVMEPIREELRGFYDRIVCVRDGVQDIFHTSGCHATA